MSKSEVQVLDFDKICRLCLLEKRSMSSIFSKKKSDKKVPLPVRIMSCASLELYEGDGLPSSICNKCLLSVNQSYAFREQCEQADTTLRQYAQRLQEASEEASTKSKEETEDEDEDETKPESEDSSSTSEPRKPKKPKKSKKSNFCSVCDLNFSDGKEYRNHVISHKMENPFKCRFCEKTFVRRDHYERHVQDDVMREACKKEVEKRHKYLKKLSCDICKLKLPDPEKLLKHYTRHVNGQSQFCCDFCLKTFKDKANLKKHRLTHTGDPQYLCASCGKKYYSVSRLNEHRSYCLNERKHSCPKCGKKFNIRSQLRRHVQIHQTDQYIKCSLCEKKFSRRDNYLQHYRLHTGEKPYTCDVCGKAFRIKGSMMYHRSLHEQDSFVKN